ncbi:MAG: zf-HC2 domain-containing protein [Oligoflexia bacterium]|nr:zf-HC2 domain-containing protein [Oligoflexia bacterium]
MAAWIDAELSPGEAELFAQHLERCPDCALMTRRMEAQVFPPIAVVDTAVPGFWDAMDEGLAMAGSSALRGTLRSAQDSPQPGGVAATAPGLLRRNLRLPGVAAFLYAALLVLAVGLAAVQSVRAANADAARLAMEQSLERQQRLSATASLDVSVEPVGLVAQGPFRGSL